MKVLFQINLPQNANINNNNTNTNTNTNNNPQNTQLQQLQQQIQQLQQTQAGQYNPQSGNPPAGYVPLNKIQTGLKNIENFTFPWSGIK